MRIIFVRHGEPNYEKDCLTPLGKLQAEAAAERLRDEGIDTVFSSPFGRALPYFAYNRVTESAGVVAGKTDEWRASLGTSGTARIIAV